MTPSFCHNNIICSQDLLHDDGAIYLIDNNNYYYTYLIGISCNLNQNIIILLTVASITNLNMLYSIIIIIIIIDWYVYEKCESGNLVIKLKTKK